MTSSILIAFLKQNKLLNPKQIERDLKLPRNTLANSLQGNGRSIPKKHIDNLTKYLSNYGLKEWMNKNVKPISKP